MNYFEHIVNEVLDTKKDNKIKCIDAPSAGNTIDKSFKVFLAGTIDADKGSIDWQHPLMDSIRKEKPNKPITIYNPRRRDWPDNGSKEVEVQIKW